MRQNRHPAFRGLVAAGLLAGLLASPTAVAQQPATQEASEDVGALQHAADHTVAWSDGLAPILKACLFADSEAKTNTIPDTAFTFDCVAPYINGLWLDTDALLRTHQGIAAQATDKLIVHPDGEPFPIYYPPELSNPVLAELREPMANVSNVVARPLPDVLPPPSLAKDSLYNNIGLLYLPNSYVVPGGTFNEMYGWDSFFIIKGMLASIDNIMRNPTSRVWSVSDRAFVQLVVDPDSDHYYRTYANRLFQVAKGMVDNHIFEIAYYGGLVLNANRTYYLTRSQPPFFTQEALAVLESARRYGFDYVETLAPYFTATQDGFVLPKTWNEWIKSEVLPAAETYYRYWTDPTVTQFGATANPRVVRVSYKGAEHDVYLYGTDGVGPAPEVARSTQPQNRELYTDAATYFSNNSDRNPDNRFYNDAAICTGDAATGGCGDPDYKLTDDFYRADRALRASGFDLSNRFGEHGEWAMNFAPISLNVLLLQMAADIDGMAMLVDESERFGKEVLADRQAFLADFLSRPSGGFGDRFAVGSRPDFVSLFAYPYATQFYILWGLPDEADAGPDVIDRLGAFLGPPGEARFGIPTSLTSSGAQWDLPYAWAPIQYFAADGLGAAGAYGAAARVMHDWIAAVNIFFADAGVIIEKYDCLDPTKDPRVSIGYAQTQRGFGWTNAVYMLFVNRLYDRL